jgi:hypothetical protein
MTTMKELIAAWDKKDINELRDLVALAGDDLDLSDLPSAVSIPDSIAAYPVWSMDVLGRALVGPAADEVEELAEIIKWCATKNENLLKTYTIRGYWSTEKIVGPGNRSSSRVNLPAHWRGKRVQVILLDH